MNWYQTEAEAAEAATNLCPAWAEGTEGDGLGDVEFYTAEPWIALCQADAGRKVQRLAPDPLDAEGVAALAAASR